MDLRESIVEIDGVSLAEIVDTIVEIVDTIVEIVDTIAEIVGTIAVIEMIGEIPEVGVTAGIRVVIDVIVVVTETEVEVAVTIVEIVDLAVIISLTETDVIVMIGVVVTVVTEVMTVVTSVVIVVIVQIVVKVAAVVMTAATGGNQVDLRITLNLCEDLTLLLGVKMLLASFVARKVTSLDFVQMAFVTIVKGRDIIREIVRKLLGADIA